MSATLKEQPPDLPGAIPAPIQRITRRCLEKEANQRFQSASDVGFALAAFLDESVNSAPATAAKYRISPKWIILAAAVAVLMIGGGYWASTRANNDAAGPDFVLRRLTLDSGLTTDGAISPDGKLVAFASDRGHINNLNIGLKQLDGVGAAVRLTNNAADNYDPAFSPDGTQIMYRSDLEGGGIYAIPSLGGEPHVLIPQGKRPRFSPNGRFLLYWKGIGSRRRPFGEFGVSLFVQTVLGGTPIQIGSNCTWTNALALWSPDSRRVIFEGLCDQQLDVWTFSIDDKHLRPSHALFKYLLDSGFRSPASAYQYPAFVFQE